MSGKGKSVKAAASGGPKKQGSNVKAPKVGAESGPPKGVTRGVASSASKAGNTSTKK